jgi:hypothetical protein
VRARGERQTTGPVLNELMATPDWCNHAQERSTNRYIYLCAVVKHDVPARMDVRAEVTMPGVTRLAAGAVFERRAQKTRRGHRAR